MKEDWGMNSENKNMERSWVKLLYRILYNRKTSTARERPLLKITTTIGPALLTCFQRPLLHRLPCRQSAYLSLSARGRHLHRRTLLPQWSFILWAICPATSDLQIFGVCIWVTFVHLRISSLLIWFFQRNSEHSPLSAIKWSQSLKTVLKRPLSTVNGNDKLPRKFS